MHIDIRTVKIYLISPGTGKYEARQQIVFQRLADLGCRNIEIVKSVEDPNPTNSLTRTNIEIFKRELNQSRPFMILEDDCQLWYEQHVFEIPDEADVVYFGVSRWVYPHSFESLWKRHEQMFHIYENQPKHHTLDMNVVRILGMTSGHAILFQSRDFLQKSIQAAETLLLFQTPHDLIFATLQRNFKVYALPIPLFYQDQSLGGQETETKVCYKGGRYIA